MSALLALTNSMMSQRHKLASTAACGFTLIELVTVIVILGILGAIAGPRMFARSPFTERGYADELAATLRAAQKVGVGSGCDVQVTINTSGYQAMQRAASGNSCSSTGAWSVPVLRADGTTLAGSPPSDANVGGSVQITFTAAGGLLTGSSASFTVGAYTISVDATTGFVGTT